MFNLCVLVVNAKSDIFIIDNNYKISLLNPQEQTANYLPV